MTLQSVLLEYTEEDIFFSSSATLLNKRWIILPAAAFIITLSNKKIVPNNIDSLETSKIYLINHFNLLTENIKIISSSQTSRNHKFQLAKYVGIFSCKNIKETNDFPLGCGHNDTSELDFNNFLSLFMIFDIKMQEKFQEKIFYDSINEIIKVSCNTFVSRGHIMCIESTPFGTRDLLASFSEGVFCNSWGRNNIFFMTDASTAPGSEGAPIFALKNNVRNSGKIPIGIVISSLNWWRGEHTGLTLGVMLVPLLSQLLPKKWSLKEYLFSNKKSVINSAEKSIVQIFCGNGWGTGVLINKKMGLFITGSHVVKSNKADKIRIKWRNRQFPGTLVYQTECFPYDIAIVTCSAEKIDKMLPIKFAEKPAIKGETVFAAGYPIFNTENSIFPVVTKGNISLVENCILHTTCCVLAGSSGGAILRENGDLLGIIVCHTTVDLKDELVVYPKINMAVPISAISKHLIDYIKTKDVSILKKLESEDPYVKNKWHLFQSKL